MGTIMFCDLNHQNCLLSFRFVCIHSEQMSAPNFKQTFFLLEKDSICQDEHIYQMVDDNDFDSDRGSDDDDDGGGGDDDDGEEGQIHLVS